MRRHVWVAAAVAFFSSGARALEGSPSLAVRAGAMANPESASPALELGGDLPLTARLALDASLGAWTLNLGPGSATELAATIGAAIAGPLTDTLSWKVAAGPAFLLSDGATTASDTFHAGLAVSPGLSLATRRRTLSLDLGARSLVFADGVRFGIVAGASYSFR